jgi:signal peptidase I
MQQEQEEKKMTSSKTKLLARDFWSLLIKIIAIATAAVLVFSFVFGIYRCNDSNMLPNIRDGDLVIYYRLDKDYSHSDVLTAKYQGNMISLRVVAVAGDQVDIREDGLYVNGYLQYEENIYEKTTRYEEGVDFPLTVGEGEVFVLGDSRENSTDSRIFGPVSVADTYGKTIMIIRRRNV